MAVNKVVVVVLEYVAEFSNEYAIGALSDPVGDARIMRLSDVPPAQTVPYENDVRLRLPVAQVKFTCQPVTEDRVDADMVTVKVFHPHKE